MRNSSSVIHVLVRSNRQGRANIGAALKPKCVKVMLVAVEQFRGAALGRSSDRNSSSSCFICAGRAATVSGLQGLVKEMVLALENVGPESGCKTCCFEGIIESQI
jgi:hypothetical protein